VPTWRGCLPKSIATGLAVGFLTGLFGVGGGFLIIPALFLILGLAMPTAVATSLVIIVVNSAAGFAAHAGDAAVDYRIAAAFTLAAIAGSLAAGQIAGRLPTQRPQRAFAWLVFAVAAFVAIQAIGTLYPILLRLEQDGLVNSAWQAGDAGPLPRRLVLIMAAGIALPLLILVLMGIFLPRTA
jgi:uncharacterized membrane protein YfcA